MEQSKPIFPVYQMMDKWAAFAYGTPEAKSHHHALYFAFVTICKNKGGIARFTMPYQTGMELCGIGSKSTYLTALKEMEGWGFLTYTPGANRFTVPIIEVHFCPSIGNLLSLYRESIGTSIDTSIATSTDASTGRNKELLDLATKEVEHLKTSLLNNQTEIDAANAALLGAQKKIEELIAERDKLAEEVATLKTQPRRLRTPGARRPAASLNPNDYQLPKWAGPAFISGFVEWLTFRQAHKAGKLQAASVQKYLDELAGYDETYSVLLFQKAVKGGYQGLTFDDTPIKFAQHLQARQPHVNVTHHVFGANQAPNYGSRATASVSGAPHGCSPVSLAISGALASGSTGFE